MFFIPIPSAHDSLCQLFAFEGEEQFDMLCWVIFEKIKRFELSAKRYKTIELFVFTYVRLQEAINVKGHLIEIEVDQRKLLQNPAIGFFVGFEAEIKEASFGDIFFHHLANQVNFFCLMVTSGGLDDFDDRRNDFLLLHPVLE